MKSIYRFYYVSLLILFLPLSFAFSQENMITVSSKLVDQTGSAVPNATIYGNEGKTISYSDNDGNFSIQVNADDQLIIEAGEFEKLNVSASSFSTGDILTLTLNPYHLRGKDDVNIPYGTMKKRQLIGAVSVIDPDEISLYDDQQTVADALRGRVPGYFNGDLRGKSEILIVVDGIPRSSSSQGSDFNFLASMNMQEIEQVTFLKDATASMLYGSKAKNGAILITTKRGEEGKTRLGLRAETGILTPVSYPDYLNAADYMSMANRARSNDGLTPIYSQDAIDSTRQGLDRIKFPDESFFNSQYLKDYSSFVRLSADASGGSDRANYFSMVTWEQSQNLFAMEQEGKSFTNNQISFRGNVNYNITDWLKASLDAFIYFGANRQPVTDFWSYASTRLPNSYPMLIPLNAISDSMLVSSAKIIENSYLLGGTNQYLDNIYGDFALGGFNTLISRTTQFNFGLDFDLKSITPGLTANIYLGYDFMNNYNISFNNEYAVYERAYMPSVSDGSDSLYLTKIGRDLVNKGQNLSNPLSERRIGVYTTLNYQRVFDVKHLITANAVGYINQTNALGNFYSDKQNHYGLRVNYMYDKRFIAQLSTALIGSGYLPEGKRYKPGYSAGLGWILSEEEFLSGSSLINYLKLNASYAKTYSDLNYPGYFLYNSSFTGGGSLLYNRNLHSNSARVYSTIANANLGFIGQTDFNTGLDALLANERIGLEASYFISTTDGNIVRRESLYPQFYPIVPYENYEKRQDMGIDLGIRFLQNTKDFRYNVGLNMSYIIPKAIAVDEPSYSETPYRSLQGNPYDAIFGYEALGLFADSADVAGSPSQSALGSTGPGDIKYKDLNGDDVIDEKDQKIIGYSKPRVQYAINISLSYKNFSLFAMGTGQSGSDAIYNNGYYWQTGQTTKYSSQVLNSWTPETAATADYPTLHLNSADNNHLRSTYWLDKNTWFRLHTLQLSYNVRPGVLSIGNGFQVYLRGSNLLTVSPIREKLDLNIGRAPQMRSFAIGLDMSF